MIAFITLLMGGAFCFNMSMEEMNIQFDSGWWWVAWSTLMAFTLFMAFVSVIIIQ